jgi:BlaR1 peptidase M56
VNWQKKSRWRERESGKNELKKLPLRVPGNRLALHPINKGEKMSGDLVFVKLLVDCTLKSALLIVFLAALAWLFRGDPRFRHRIWTTGAASLLALPLLSLLLPQWQIPLPRILSAGQDSLLAGISGRPDPVISIQSELATRHDASLVPAPPIDAPSASSVPVSSAPARADGHVAELSRVPADRETASLSGEKSRLPESGATEHNEPSRMSVGLFGLWIWGSVCAALGVALIARLVRTVRLSQGLPCAGRMALAVTSPDDRGLLDIRRDKTEAAVKGTAGKTVPVYESDWIRGPAANGYWSRYVVLPKSWRRWPDELLGSVLSHERAHLRRRDAWWNLLAELCCCIHWYNPLSWYIRGRILASAELACDVEAALESGDRLNYASHLLQIAALGSRARHSLVLTGMALRGGVAGRIRYLAESGESLHIRSPRWLRLVSMIGIGFLVTGLGSAVPGAIGDREEASSAETAPERPTAWQQEPAVPNQDVVRTIDGITYLVVRGEIVLPDRSIPQQLSVRGYDHLETSEISDKRFSVDGNRFEILIPGDYAQLVAETADHKYRAFFVLNEPKLYEARKSGSVRVVLDETLSATVKVLDENGQPVADAQVNTVVGRVPPVFTNQDGNATVHAMKRDKELYLSARKGNQRAFRYLRTDTPDFEERDAPIELRMVTEPLERLRIVDEKGNPIAGFSRSPVVGQLTDDDGFTEYMPGGELVSLDYSGCPWRLREVKMGEEYTTAVLTRKAPMVRIRGNCQPANLVPPGALIAFQNEESDLDSASARVNAEGEFAADLLAGHEYSIRIQEPDVISGTVRKKIDESDAAVTLDIETGMRVKLRVTEGESRRPISDRYVSVSYDDPHRSFDCKTDIDGNVSAWIHKHVQELIVWDGSESATAAVELQPDGDAIAVAVFPDNTPSRKYRVRLSSDAKTADSLANAKLEIFDADGQLINSVSADPAGYCEFETDCAYMLLVARSSDGKQAGTCRLAAPNATSPDSPDKASLDTTRIDLKEARQYRGRLVDAGDKPMAGQEVSVGAYFTMRGDLPPDPESPPMPRSYSLKPFVFCKTVITDAEGRFSVDGIPPGTRMEACRGPNVGGRCLKSLDADDMESGVDTIRLWPATEVSGESSPMQFGNDLDAALRAAAESNKPVLVAIWSPNRTTPGFLADGLFNPSRLAESAEYIPFVVTKMEPFDVWEETAKRLNIAMPDMQDRFGANTEVELRILNPDGTERKRETFCATDENVIEQIRGFLRRQDK